MKFVHSMYDLMPLQVELNFLFFRSTQTLVDFKEVTQSMAMHRRINVEIFGDLLPTESLPTDVQSAVGFLSSMPERLSQGDLPKRLFLTPLSEIPCTKGRRLQTSR